MDELVHWLFANLVFFFGNLSAAAHPHLYYCTHLSQVYFKKAISSGDILKISSSTLPFILRESGDELACKWAVTGNSANCNLMLNETRECCTLAP